MLAERFSEDPLETCFCMQHLSGAWEDELPPMAFAMPTYFETKTYSSQ